MAAAAFVLASSAIVAPGWTAPPAPQLRAATPHPFSETEALAQARRTGKAVEVTGATTPTDTLTANPNGSLTLTRHAAPVRKRVNGTWTDLDASLRRNADGTVSPRLTSSDIFFSGGGNGPLATLRHAGKSLALSVPVTLPAPVLSGATALYPAVLPGVDLRVTATRAGGFTQLFIVRDAAAAANPLLRNLTQGMVRSGLTVSADVDGNLKAVDALGKPVFAAPAPVMWDSATAATAKAARPAKPGAGARFKPVGVRLTRDGVTLTPDAGMLAGEQVSFPLLIDPSWTPVMPTTGSGAGPNPGYASVAEAFPTSNKWNNTADPNDDNMQLGWANNPWHARTMINFGIDVGRLSGASISNAHIDATVVYSGSCTASRTRVFAPATTLDSSNATWNNWYYNIPLGNEVSSATFAGGYNSNCGPHAIIPPFDVLGAVNTAVAAGRWVQTFVFTGDVNETSDTASYKELSLASMALSITFNHTPNAPTNLTTSPNTPCTGGTVGDGDVLLYAPVSDPDGGTIGVRYEAWKNSAPGTLIASTDPANTPYTSGSTAVLTLSQSTLRTQAGGQITAFSWRVQVWDGFATGGWSSTCTFTFDPTRPGAPFATPPAEGTTHIGTPVQINVTKPSGGTTPSGYRYQLNAGAPGSVGVDASGNGVVTITPARRTNTLTIVALSAGGNAGIDAAVINFTTAPPTGTPAHADLTGDGAADLVVAGGGNGFASGVWLGQGKNTSQVTTNATNIGINGNGVVGDRQPSNFDGAQIITGVFAGNGVQDILAYYPGTGAGSIISGNGDGSALLPQLSGNQFSLFATEFLDEGTVPLQLANAGDAIANGDNSADLIGIGGPAGSRHLNYYFYASVQNKQGILNLTPHTPAGDMAWDQWKIATALVPNGSTTQTDMFLWHPGTGALYLWRNLDVRTGDLAFTPYQLAASGWNPGGSLTLQASDVDGNGVPDLWTFGAGRTVTANLVGNLSGGTGTVTAQTAQTIATASHTWTLSDIPGGAVNGTTVASAGDVVPAGTVARPLTGVTGATWHTGDLFNPDVQLNGSGGTLAANGAAVATNADFTISAWVKPSDYTGTVLSQDGTNTAGFRLYADSATKSWRFALSQSDSPTPVWDTVWTPNDSVQTGVWTQLTATYKQSNGLLSLYVNGVNVLNAANHTSTWNATGAFRAGAQRTSAGGFGAYFAGQIAGVQAWNQISEPAQPQTAPSFYQRITPTRFLDTRDGTGGTTGAATGGNTIKLKIAGANGIPATAVTAVGVNLTVVSPSAPGILVAYPDLKTRALSTNLNYVAVTQAGYAIVPVGTNGYIDLYLTEGSGSAHLLADVNGYFTSDAAAAGNMTFYPVGPNRIADSRTGLGGFSTKITGGTSRDYTVTGGAVPAGVRAVAVNITTLSASSPSFFITWEQGQPRPVVSGVQYTTSTTTAIAGMTIVPVNPATGKISLFSGATTEVIIDMLGYFGDGAGGQKYHSLNAVRLLDTRQGAGPIGSFGSTSVVAGNNVAAASPTLVLNLIATGATAGGVFQAYPGAGPVPSTSNLNFDAGQTIANLTIVNTGTAGSVALRNGSSATVHAVVDCTGYFA